MIDCLDLIVVSCCAKKLAEPAPAGELYQSRVYSLLRDHATELDAAGVGLAVMSAEYGLITWESMIEPYDRKMTAERAAELEWRCRGQAMINFGSPRYVYAFGGKIYRDAIAGAFSGCNVVELVGEGRGCGDHFRALKNQVLEILDQSSAA